MEYQIVKKWDKQERKAYYTAQYCDPETGEWKNIVYPAGILGIGSTVSFPSIRKAKEALRKKLEEIRAEEDPEIVKIGRLL